ncbi:MAG: AsmA family protein [Terriglobia bacterium]
MPFFHRHRARTALLILAGALLAGWLVPPFFHAGRYRKILRSTLENNLGRPVVLGAVTLRLLPHPGFSIHNVIIEEDPRFGSEPFARVDRVECDLRWGSLWGSRLDCSRIILSDPVLNVVRDVQGQWNIEEFFHRGGAEVKAAAAGTRCPAAEPFDFEVDGARVNFTVNGVKKPFALDRVQAQLQFDPRQRSVQFRIQGTPVRTDLSLQPPGPFLLTGEWQPATGFNGPFHARLTTHGSLLYGWIPLILHRDPGVYGLANADIQLAGSIHRVKITGQMQINQLHLWDSLPPSSVMPVSLSFAGEWDRDQGRVQIQKADAAFSGSHLRLTGMISRISGAPHVDLVLALHQSRLEDLVALANRLTKHPTSLAASGRVDALLTLQGPWQERRYGGFVGVRSLALSSHGVELSSRQVGIHVDDQGAHLAPTHFFIGAHIQGIAEGSMALPGGAPGVQEDQGSQLQLRISPHPARREALLPRATLSRRERAGARIRKGAGPLPGGQDGAPPRYELVFTLKKAPLRDCIRIVRSLGVGQLRDVDATGWASASIRFSGRAWPFSRPQLSAQGDLGAARLLVAGLNEPVRFSRFHFELANGAFVAMPVTAGIGDASFSGWLKHGPARETPWRFDARTSRLSLEQASLWFTVLGYRRPMPILDLIPGLRSLAGRATASRNVFAAVNARGSFECPEVTFHTLNLEDFRAGVTLSGRVARISAATFRVAGGRGDGSAEVDFKQAPAHIIAQFGLSGLRLQRFAGKLPAALGGIRGALSAVGHLATRGLTRPEMSAHLAGKVEVRLRNVTLGSFDPLEAAARAASLGVLAPARTELSFPSLEASLGIGNQSVTLSPAQVFLSGAALRLAGSYNFNGNADLTLSADMTHVHRRWMMMSGDTRNNPSRRVATLHLVGRLKSLTVIPVIETAQAHR